MERIDHYEVRGELGRGAAGVVYRAYDPRLDRDVAIKMLLATKSGDTQLARFRREARALARIQHENIVGVLQIGEHSGKPFIVMDYVEGESLQGRLDRSGPLPPELAVTIIAKAARALVVAHDRGVLHRDLKPENILISSADEPLITDFGLAKDVEDPGKSAAISIRGRFMGTPGFAAPEQAKGEDVGPSTDVYGLGATLFALVTRKPPFTGSSMVEVVIASTTRTAPKLSERGGPDDPELDQLCARCLEREPAHRFASAAELADACERYLRGEPSGAWRPVPVEKARRGSDAPKLALALTATFLVGLGVGALGLWGRLGAERERHEATVRELRAGMVEIAARIDEEPRREPLRIDAARTEARRRTDTGIERYLRADYAGAIAELTRAIQADPRNRTAWVFRAWSRQARQDWRGAIDDWSQAIELDPSAAGIWIARAQTKLSAGDVASATQDATRAIELDPDTSNGWRTRGICWGRAQRWPEAVADFAKAAELEPELASNWINLAQVRMQTGDTEGTIADLEEAIRRGVVNPDSIRSQIDELRSKATPASPTRTPTAEDWKEAERWREAGDAKAAARDYAGAEADYGKALAINPLSARASRSRGSARFALGDTEGALADLDRAISLQPTSAEYIETRGAMKGRIGDYSGAIADFDRAIELDPGLPRAWMNRGSAKHLTGDHEGAIVDLDRAIDLDPSSVQAWLHRGLAKEKCGEVEPALRDLSRAIELAPTVATTWIERGSVKWRSGNLEGAMVDYEAGSQRGLADDPRVREGIARLRQLIEEQDD